MRLTYHYQNTLSESGIFPHGKSFFIACHLHISKAPSLGIFVRPRHVHPSIRRCFTAAHLVWLAGQDRWISGAGAGFNGNAFGQISHQIFEGILKVKMGGLQRTTNRFLHEGVHCIEATRHFLDQRMDHLPIFFRCCFRAARIKLFGCLATATAISVPAFPSCKTPVEVHKSNPRK